MNLKYSDNPIEDYKKLSIGRKLYIEKRATKLTPLVRTHLDKMDIAVKGYLLKKYIVGTRLEMFYA